MLDSLYENIGVKIKNWAKWIFIVEAIGAVITGIALAVNEDALYIFIAIGGPIVAWVGSWILYAFGELVEDIHALRYNSTINNIDKNVQLLATPIIKEAEEKAKREAEEKAKRKAEEKVKREAEEKAKIQKQSFNESYTPEKHGENEIYNTFWTCGKCKKTNLISRNDCWSCGNPK